MKGPEISGRDLDLPEEVLDIDPAEQDLLDRLNQSGATGATEGTEFHISGLGDTVNVIDTL